MHVGNSRENRLVPGWPRAIKVWGRELGFADIGITHVDLSHAEAGLLDWLAAGYHGEMDYMARHGLTRARPAELVPGTVSVITARLDYRPTENMAADSRSKLAEPRPCLSCRVMRWAATITRCCATSCSASPTVSTPKLGDRRRVQLPRLHRLGPGHGGRARRHERPGLARQAHAAAQPLCRLLLLSSANCSPICPCPPTRRPAITAAPARHVSTSVRRKLSLVLIRAGCTALHFLSDHRTQGQHSC